MYLITLLPLLESAQGEVTYISTTSYPRGAVIRAPWRSTSTLGVVTNIQEAAAVKSFLRHATFQVRRIPENPIEGWVPLYLLDSITAVVQQKGIVPSPLAVKVMRVSPDQIVEPQGPGYTETYIEGPLRDRIVHYKTLALTEHPLIIAPTQEEVRILKAALPKAYVSTPAVIRALPEKVSTIVIERESSEAYLMRRRPYADIRDVIAAVAVAQNIPLVWADDLIRLERCNEMPVISLGTPPKPTIITREKDDGGGVAIPKQARDEIDTCIQNGQTVFVYAARSGHAQSIVCRDCGALYTCPECSSPLRLRATRAGRIFWCPRCRYKEPPESRCHTCTSWNLMDLGIGSEKIAEELAEYSPVLVDTFHGSATASRKRIAEKMKTGGVIIGTQRALRYLTHIDLAIVPTIDSLLALPHWRSRETLARTMATICSMTQKTLIYTRQDPQVLTALFESGRDTREAERSIRKRFEYPPYTNLLGIITPKELPRLRTLPHSTYVGESKSYIHGKPVFLMRFRVSDPSLIHTILLSFPPSIRVEWNPEWW